MSDDKGTDSPKGAYLSLKLKYRKFVDAYFLENGCAAKAFRRLYPNRKRPDCAAWKLLQLPEIRAAIQERSDFELQERGLTVHRLRSMLFQQATFDVRKLYRDGRLLQIPELDDDTAAALGGVEVFDTNEGRVRKYSAESKQRAQLELLRFATLNQKEGEDRLDDEPIGKIVVEVVSARVAPDHDGTPG